MTEASDAILSLIAWLAFAAAAMALVVAARGFTAKATREQEDLERRQTKMLKKVKAEGLQWQSSCTLLAQPGYAHWYRQNLSIPRGGFGTSGHERFEVNVVRCEASVEYTGREGFYDTMGPGSAKANVFASFNFADQPEDELCESVLHGETWPNIELAMPGTSDIGSWACGNATYVQCDWSDSSAPSRSDCRTTFGSGPNEAAVSSSHCWTIGWWGQSSTCFEGLWVRRCPLQLTVGRPVPCLVDLHGGQVRIGTLETLAVELAGGLPSTTWRFGQVSLDEATLPWWLHGAAGLCLMLALVCFCRSLVLCRRLTRPMALKQDLELESRDIVHKITRFGVTMKRFDIKMDDYGKDRKNMQQKHLGGEAFGFLRESKCCNKTKSRPQQPRTLREELTEERQVLLPAD